MAMQKVLHPRDDYIVYVKKEGEDLPTLMIG